MEGEEVHCRLKENLDADVQLGGWGPISSFDDGPPVLAKNLVFTVAKMEQPENKDFPIGDSNKI